MKKQGSSHLQGKVWVAVEQGAALLVHSLHSSHASGHSSGPKTHPHSVIPDSSKPGYTFLGGFIIPGTMDVLVSSGHQADLSPQLSGSLEHCVMQTLCTFQYLFGVLWKGVPYPSKGRKWFGMKKTFLWWVGGRRGCATQEINNQILVKLLLKGTRQIMSRVRDEKKPWIL